MKNINVNKKLFIIIIIILVLGYAAISVIERNISNDFAFSDEELDLIKSLKDLTIDVGLSEHFLWSPDILKELSNQLKDNLEISFNFRVTELGDSELMSYPSGLYQELNIESETNRIGYLESDYPSPHIAGVILQAYNSIDLLYDAIQLQTVDAVMLPYQGDFIYSANLKLVALNSENSLPITLTSSEPSSNTILIKALALYQNDGLFEELLNQLNDSNHQNHMDLIFESSDLETLHNVTLLTVGIENNPPIAYIKDKKIHGMAVALLKSFANAGNFEIEFIIGEYDILNTMYENKEINLLLTTHPDDEKALTIISDTYIVASRHDVKFHRTLDTLLNEDFISYHIDTYPVETNTLNNFDDLMADIRDDKEHYYILPQKMFEFISEKMNVPTLYLNHLFDQNITYYYKGNEKILKLFSKYSAHIDKERLSQLSLYFIDDERQEKTNLIIGIVIFTFVCFILIMVLIIRIMLNINEKRRLNYLFKHDQLTYLPNAYGLKKIFNSINNKHGVIMLVDLRRFKLINDTFGTDIGDQILIELANRFKAIDDQLVVARTSGDQFTFLLNQKLFDHYLNEILLIFETYKIEETHAKKLNLSACYVEFPEYGTTYETLIQYLESAMYHTKAMSLINSWVAFDQSIYQTYLEEQEMAIEIQSAIDQEDLLLFYQPQTDLETEKTIGAEVLVRWVHKERGNIYPDQFLGVAERNGLMRKLDMYMIRKACEQLKIWQDLSYEHMKISVNMSTYTFESKSMSIELLDIIKQSEIDTSWFAIEITEESGLSNLKYAKKVMDDIKTQGVRFALDDFGKGYSSLSYLEQLPFDFLKIDKAFVDNIHTSEKSKILYYLITDLAKLFDMHIIAEGVEYTDQINIIKKDMETIIQGYYYSKPLPLEAFEKRLKDQ